MIDPQSDHGVVYVKHYPYRTPGGAKPAFILSRKQHHKWFDLYCQEIKLMWDDAVPWHF